MRWCVAGFIALAGLAPSASVAGPFADDLTKCFIESSGTEGKTTIMQWMFVAMGKNPAVQQYISVTAAQKEDVDKKVAALWQKLFTQDCRDKTVAALKYEGPQVIPIAFQAMGQAAALTIMSGPDTAAAMGAYTAYLDWEKISSIFTEAGLPAPPPPAQTKP